MQNIVYFAKEGDRGTDTSKCIKVFGTITVEQFIHYMSSITVSRCGINDFDINHKPLV